MNTINALDDRFFFEIFVTGVYPVIQSAKIVVDVGACNLEYSIAVYPHAEKIFAIEPHPQRAIDIDGAIKRHGLNKIIACPFALASRSEMRKFGGLSNYGGSCLDRDDEWVMVKTLTMNDFMGEYGIEHVDVLKVDVEGAEKEIFNGDFPYEKVDNIFFEVHAGADGVAEILKEKGFEIDNKHSICMARRANAR